MEENIINVLENQSCIICLNDNFVNQDMCITNCSHIFCKECLDKWFDRGEKSCPICRGVIQYFVHKDINYRVIIYNSVTHGYQIISNEVIENLIKLNYNLRFFIFIMTVFVMVGYNYYRILQDDYQKLHVSYNYREQNITLLSNELRDCYSEGNNMVYIDVWGAGEFMRKCLIPLTSYIQCFPENHDSHNGLP